MSRLEIKTLFVPETNLIFLPYANHHFALLLLLVNNYVGKPDALTEQKSDNLYIKKKNNNACSVCCLLATMHCQTTEYYAHW